MRWRRLWIGALLIAGIGVAGWEMFWRAQGMSPMPNDDVGLWALARAEASTPTAHGSRVVVFTGSSRAQLAIDTHILAETIAEKPIQLAIDGHPGLRVLRHLSEDVSFHGVVICEFIEKYMPGVIDRRPEPVPEEWIRAYDGANVFTRFEWRAKRLVQGALALRLPQLAPRNLAAHLRRGELPPRFHITTEYDRSKRADYAAVDVAGRRASNIEVVRSEMAAQPAPALERFLAGADELRVWAGRIRARGGEVVFVRLPTSGEIWEMENAAYPKDVYWDAFARRVESPAIHFLDYEALRGFECADGTHLDYREARRFTRALAEVLTERGVLKLR